jgi:hypothetical protein
MKKGAVVGFCFGNNKYKTGEKVMPPQPDLKFIMA